jgi:hypothetical protein
MSQTLMKKLIAIALRKIPEKYGQAFSILNVALDRQVDLDTCEDACKAMYHTTAKIDDDSDGELSLAGFNKKEKENKWKGKKHCDKK